MAPEPGRAPAPPAPGPDTTPPPSLGEFRQAPGPLGVDRDDYRSSQTPGFYEQKFQHQDKEKDPKWSPRTWDPEKYVPRQMTATELEQWRINANIPGQLRGQQLETADQLITRIQSMAPREMAIAIVKELAERSPAERETFLRAMAVSTDKPENAPFKAKVGGDIRAFIRQQMRDPSNPELNAALTGAADAVLGTAAEAVAGGAAAGAASPRVAPGKTGVELDVAMARLAAATNDRGLMLDLLEFKTKAEMATFAAEYRKLTSRELEADIRRVVVAGLPAGQENLPWVRNAIAMLLNPPDAKPAGPHDPRVEAVNIFLCAMSLKGPGDHEGARAVLEAARGVPAEVAQYFKQITGGQEPVHVLKSRGLNEQAAALAALWIAGEKDPVKLNYALFEFALNNPANPAAVAELTLALNAIDPATFRSVAASYFTAYKKDLREVIKAFVAAHVRDPGTAGQLRQRLNELPGPPAPTP